MDCIKVLLRRKADLNSTTAAPRRLTPLIVAADRGHAQAVDYLLHAKADHLRTDSGGQTALDCALYEGHADVVLIFKKWEPELRRREALRYGCLFAAKGGSGRQCLFLP